MKIIVGFVHAVIYDIMNDGSSTRILHAITRPSSSL